MLVRGYWHL